MSAPGTGKGRLVRIKFEPIEPKPKKIRVTKKEKELAELSLPEFWASLPESERRRLRELSKGL